MHGIYSFLLDLGEESALSGKDLVDAAVSTLGDLYGNHLDENNWQEPVLVISGTGAIAIAMPQGKKAKSTTSQKDDSDLKKIIDAAPARRIQMAIEYAMDQFLEELAHHGGIHIKRRGVARIAEVFRRTPEAIAVGYGKIAKGDTSRTTIRHARRLVDLFEFFSEASLPPFSRTISNPYVHSAYDLRVCIDDAEARVVAPGHAILLMDIHT